MSAEEAKACPQSRAAKHNSKPVDRKRKLVRFIFANSLKIHRDAIAQYRSTGTFRCHPDFSSDE
ncbi:hypothetical protein [Polaromonas sp. Pch-P]|uniref:hypothetical protein n=1 Tax=Polaromonas sp. Pch-P TaxID=2082385 RepID=UPI001E649A1A|nr:hypothetical protein [Polaromonas sp. Pch-P]